MQQRDHYFILFNSFNALDKILTAIALFFISTVKEVNPIGAHLIGTIGILPAMLVCFIASSIAGAFIHYRKKPFADKVLQILTYIFAAVCTSNLITMVGAL